MLRDWARKLVAVFTLFRFANGWNLILLLVGTLAAIVHGLALPISMHYFGILTNIFVNQFTSKTLANFVFRFEIEDVLDSQCLLIINPTLLAAGVINFTMITGGVVNCSDDFVLIPDVVNFNTALQCGVTRLATCLEDGEFITLVDPLVIGFVIIGAIVLVVGTLQVFAFQVTSDNQARTIKLKLFRAILYQDAKWFDGKTSGELSSRLSSDIEKIHEGIGVKLALFIQWMTTFIAGFVIGFIREWRLALLLLGITPFIILTVAVSYVVILVLTSKELRQYASASAVVEEALASIKTVVAYGGEKVEAKRYDGKLQEARRTASIRGFIVSLSLGIIYFLIFLCYAIGFWFGAWLISQQLVQAGDILTVFFSVIIGIFSLGQAIPNLEKLITAAGASITIYSIIDQDPSSGRHEATDSTGPSDGSISFENITFAYPSRPDIPVLKDFTLKVAGNTTVALVGPSGSGKTTALQLLMRFYELSAGQLLLGGMDIHSLSLETLRNRFGIVGQEPVLFDTTVAENIGLGKREATVQEIEQAGKDANVHEFVSSSLPEGYDTNVGKQGTQMSGGQKQRIAIARALIRNPHILLLDDATSALDSESERIVQHTLDKASSGRTTIIVSHRLSTIKNADLIAFMENGAVVELGTHQELMDKKGAYYQFAFTQFAEVNEESLVAADSEGLILAEKSVEFQRMTSVTSKEGESGDIKLLELSQTQHVSESDADDKSVSWWRLWRMNSPEAPLLVLGVLSAAMQGTIYPMFAFFFGQVLRVFTLPFDQVIAEIHVWAGTFVILGLLSGLATFVKNLVFFVSGSRLTHRLQFSTFNSILHQEIAWFDRKENSPAALTARLASDAQQVQGATGIQFGTLVESVVSILVAVVISLAVNQLLALVIIGFLPFLIVPGLIQFCILSSYNSSYKRHNDQAEKIAIDSINNYQTVSALSVEEQLLAKYSKTLDKAYRYSYLAGLGYGITYAFAQGAVFIGYTITFRFGAYQSVQGFNSTFYVGLDNIYIVFMALIFGSLALGQSGDFAPNYTRAKNSAKRVFALLDRPSAIDSNSKEGITPDGCSGRIVLSKVRFNYPTRPGVSVMRDMGLVAAANKTTALVGPSGYGKSTVMSLLERFYDPLRGGITLDGIEIARLNIQWLRSQIGIVFQEPVLFDSSIAENIAYGANHREVSMEEIEQAAKNASIDEFIMSLPLGYATIVGEGGGLLSRGQKQRIAIARALLRDPRVLLLDEATSALDPESEREVQSVLDVAMKDRTSIVIAHRLATIHNADKIAVLKGGRVSEEGSHSELMEKEGLYRKMYLYQTEKN